MEIQYRVEQVRDEHLTPEQREYMHEVLFPRLRVLRRRARQRLAAKDNN